MRDNERGDNKDKRQEQRMTRMTQGELIATDDYMGVSFII